MNLVSFFVGRSGCDLDQDSGLSPLSLWGKYFSLGLSLTLLKLG